MPSLSCPDTVLHPLVIFHATQSRSTDRVNMPSPFCLPWCSLNAYSPSTSPLSDPSHGLTVASKHLFSSLTRSAQPVGPMEFILCLRRKYPQFAQTSRYAVHAAGQ